MSPSPVCAHVPQTLDITDDGTAQVVVDLHCRKVGVEVEKLLVVELADGGTLVDVELAHDKPRHVGPDAIEGLERFLQEKENRQPGRGGPAD